MKIEMSLELTKEEQTEFFNVLNRLIPDKDRDKIVSALGVAVRENTVGIELISQKGKLCLPAGARLSGSFRGIDYNAVIKDGKIYFNDVEYETPSGAAIAITKRSTNGWDFWSVDGKTLYELREEQNQNQVEDKEDVLIELQESKINEKINGDTTPQKDFVNLILLILLKAFDYRLPTADVRKEVEKSIQLKTGDYEVNKSGYIKWHNNLAWAREILCKDGLLLRPQQSGCRGIWQLSPAGIAAAKLII